MTDDTRLKQRQAIYWHLVGSVYGLNDVGTSFETMTKALVEQLELPQAILDSGISLEVLLHRYPQLQPHFDACQALMNEEASSEPGEIDLRTTLAYVKMLLNVFGPNTREATCNAAQYSQWCNDVAALETCFGYGPGELRQSSASKPGSDAESGRSGHGISGRARALATSSFAKS